MDDFDNLQSIFQFRIKGETKTSEALALEAKGDYLSAIDIYTEVEILNKTYRLNLNHVNFSR